MGGGGDQAEVRSLEHAGRHFGRWLRSGSTACGFAQHFAGSAQLIAQVCLSGVPSASDLDDIFLGNSTRVPVVVIPVIASERELVRFLQRLPHDSDRWSIHRRDVSAPSGGVAVGIEWITANQQRSHVMGFAPLLTMPSTRRAPYVGLSTWPGAHANPFRQPRRPRAVSFIDAAHQLDQQEHDRMYAGTERAVAELLGDVGDEPVRYRHAAFVLDEAYARDLDFA